LRADIDTSWQMPPTVQTWGAPVSIETIRFAAANRLCIELGYGGTTRVVEPYSFRRTRDGNYLLYAIKRPSGETRAYRLDRIQSVRVTDTPFVPRHRIEIGSFSVGGAPRLSRTAGASVRRPPRKMRARGVVFIVQCPVCGRKFPHQTPSPALKTHKGPDGWSCPSRSGFIVETRNP